ncbi:MAG: PAS domain S-box-containing protein [Alphaproteobacteria bacterium]|jgi:PAS domain S-box-containing protein
MRLVVPDGDSWRARKRAALGIVPLAALLLGVVSSLAGFRLIDGVVRHDVLSSFNLVAGRQVSALQQKLERSIETVHALGGLFDASDVVSRAEFSAFSNQMISRVSGVQALSWNPRIPHSQLSGIRQLAQQEGMSGYEFFEKGVEGNRQSLTLRDDYVTVLYVEPFESNRAALGYDVGSDPTRRAALDRARDTGTAVSSGPVRLVQGTTNEYGFLVFRPVYLNGQVPETLEDRKHSIKGYTVGVYNVRDVLTAALGETPPADTRVTVYDGVGNSRSRKAIYDTAGLLDERDPAPTDEIQGLLVHTAQLALPMRSWTVVIQPTGTFSSPIERGVVWIFLAAGALVSLVVYGFLVSGRMRNLVIEREVDNRTRELAAEIVERKSVETALQRSERTYAILAEMAPIGILIFKDRKVDHANFAAVRLLGAASPEDLMGRNRQDFLRPEDRDEATRRWKSVTDGHTLESWDVETIRLDGASFPSVIRTERVDIDGHIYTIVAIEDVTLAKQAEQAIRESEEKYRSLIESFPQGVLLSEQGVITQINPAGLRLYGAQNDKEVLGRDWMSLVDESERERMLERRRTMAEGSSVEPIEVKMLRVDGTSFWGRSQAMPVSVGGETFFMTVFADVTDRKLAEQEIQRANSELVRSNEELAQFAYVASHDLKEPLRMVSSYCDLIADRYTDTLDEAGKKFIHYATDGAKRMQVLIDDLLLYSRIGRGGETEEPVDLGLVVADVLEIMSEPIRQAGATVTVDKLPVVIGFRSELTRLFQNLFANAIKFRSDVPPKIEIRGVEQDGGIRISVADNGIGIALEYREKVFGVFQRLHSRDKYEGTGIGLAICEKVVEQMGGEIWVEESIGAGSEFVFTIPGERLHTA